MSEWISVKDRLPENDHCVYVLGNLTQEHMWITNRQKPYDVISGAYLHMFPDLYTHWHPITAPPQPSQPEETK